MRTARLPNGSVGHAPTAARAHECKCYSIAEYRAKAAAAEANRVLAAHPMGARQVRLVVPVGSGFSVRDGCGGRDRRHYCALVAGWAVRRPKIRWVVDIASCLVGFLVGWFAIG